jgi:WD40 repeat protein
MCLPRSIPQLVASGSNDKTVRLWDAVTGAARGNLVGHSGLVNAVAFSPDGQLLASGSFDKTVRLWEAATGAMRCTLEGHSREVTAVTFSLDGQLLASGSFRHKGQALGRNNGSGALHGRYSQFRSKPVLL